MKIVSAILTTLVPISIALECQRGWIKYDSHNASLTCQPSDPPKGYRKCIKMFDEAKKWDIAKSSCQDEKGQLIKIESKEENDFLLNKLLRIPSNAKFIEAWIGLSDKDKENTFVWTDGTPLNLNENCSVWADDQPNDELGQDCVEIENGVFWLGGPPQIGVWNDFHCNKTLKYICEKKREEYKLKD